MKRTVNLLNLLLFCMVIKAADGIQLLPSGEGLFTYNEYAPFANRPIDVHYYIPEGNDQKHMKVIIVFQGNDRKWEYLLDAWEQAAEKERFMVFVPQFDKDLYPLSDYHELGITDVTNKQLKDRNAITPLLIDHMFEYIKQHTVTESNKYSIYGHSAGGQFVHRFMLFHDSPYVDRAVIGSPGWYTFPDRKQDYPYGIKNVPYVSDEHLKKMFSKDIVVELSECDTVREWFLRKTAEADAQGRNRLERGKTYYEFCRKLCLERGWNFRWRKIVVPKLGHQSTEMGMAAVPMLIQPAPQELHTPSLSLGETEVFASMQQITSYLQQLANEHPSLAKMKIIGKSNDGYNIPIIYLGKNKWNPVKVWIQGGLHGNEPAGPEIVCYLASYLLNDVHGRALLKHTNIALLPVANPDGYSKQMRYSGTGLDLNRDQTKFNDKMTTVLKKAYLEWYPDVALDIHEFNPRRKEMERLNGHKLETDYDILFLNSGHPNINNGIRSITLSVLQASAEKALKERGYKTGFYFTPIFQDGELWLNKDAKSPQSSSTWNALNDAVSLFIEIKGIGYGKNLFEKRVDCGFTYACSILECINLHHNEIYRHVEDARKQTIEGSTEIIVTFKPLIVEKTVDFLDLETGKEIHIQAKALDAIRAYNVLKRTRPVAYAINADQTNMVNKLKAMGFKVEKLKNKKIAITEQYKVDKLTVADELEKIHPTTVSTITKMKKHVLPVGTYIVRTNQNGGNLLVTLLEPESANGFVNFQIVKAKTNVTLPFMRVLKFI